VEHAGAFVLELIIEDTERFIENGIIQKDDIPGLYDLRQARLASLWDRLWAAAPHIDKETHFLPLPLPRLEIREGSEQYNVHTQLNRVQLRNAITAAQATLRRTLVADASFQIPDGLPWVSTREAQNFAAVIENANTRYGQITSRDQLLEEQERVILATHRFAASTQAGTGRLPFMLVPVRDEIVTTINAMQDVYISHDGTDVWETRFWVTPNEWAAINNSLDTAQNAIRTTVGFDFGAGFGFGFGFSPLSSTIANDNQARAEAQRVQITRNTFLAARKPGGLPIDRTLVEAAITEARFLLDTIVISTNGANVPADVRWWTQDVYNTLLAAVTQAQQALAAVHTPQQIYAVFNNLNSTMVEIMFGTQQNPGGINNQWGFAAPTEENREVINNIREIIEDTIAFAKIFLLGEVYKSEDGLHATGNPQSGLAQRALHGGVRQYSLGAPLGADTPWVFPVTFNTLEADVQNAENALARHLGVATAGEAAGTLLRGIDDFTDSIITGTWGNFSLPHGVMVPLLDQIAEGTEALITAHPLPAAVWELNIHQLELHLQNNPHLGITWGDYFTAQRYWSGMQSALINAIVAAMRAGNAAEANDAAQLLLSETERFGRLTRRLMPDFSFLDQRIEDAAAYRNASLLDANHTYRLAFVAALTLAQNRRATALTPQEVAQALADLNTAIDAFLLVSTFEQTWAVDGLAGSFGCLNAAMAAAGSGRTVRLTSPIARLTNHYVLTANVTVPPATRIIIAEGASLTVPPGRLLYVESNFFDSTHGEPMFSPAWAG
jgi:hypothetical protein